MTDNGTPKRLSVDQLAAIRARRGPDRPPDHPSSYERDVGALLDHIVALEAEIQQLRGALELYADEDNWSIPTADCGYEHFAGDGPRPAQAALSVRAPD